MTTCTFAGHRQVIGCVTDKAIDDALERMMSLDTDFVFYTGGTGEFDNMCSAAVRRAKQNHSDKRIRLFLVLPYMKTEASAHKNNYSTIYDDIFVPRELCGIHSKNAVKARDRYMIDHSDFLIACVFHRSGGAFESLKYAKSLQNIKVINLSHIES